MKRIRAHLIEAHNFASEVETPDDVALHDADHDRGTYMHPYDDLYLAVEDDDDTSDPDQEVDA